MVEMIGRLLSRSHSRIFMPDLHCIIIMPANVCPFDTTIIHPNEQVQLHNNRKTSLDLKILIVIFTCFLISSFAFRNV